MDFFLDFLAHLSIIDAQDVLLLSKLRNFGSGSGADLSKLIRGKE